MDLLVVLDWPDPAGLTVQLQHSLWSVLAFNYRDSPWHALVLDRLMSGKRLMLPDRQPRQYFRHVLGLDVGRPGGDRPTFVHATYGKGEIYFIDDPLNDREITKEQRAKMAEWWGKYSNRALESSFCVPETIRMHERELVPAKPAVPWYRQSDRQLNGRRR